MAGAKNSMDSAMGFTDHRSRVAAGTWPDAATGPGVRRVKSTGAGIAAIAPGRVMAPAFARRPGGHRIQPG